MDSDECTTRGWGREPGGVQLDFAIIGAQKSASTFLQRRLAEHADITVLRRESWHFEDPDYGRGGLQDLTDLLAPHTGSVTGVKRPDYLPKPEVPRRVARHVPRIKLMAVLREPVARAVSAYFHLAVWGFVPVMDHSEALAAILDGRLQRDHPKSQEVLEYGRYASHLGRWRDWFAPEQFLILLHEEVARDPAGSLSAALRFLDAADTVRLDTAQSRANTGVYWPPRVRLRAARSRRYYDYDATYDTASPKRMGPLGWGAVVGITALDKLVLGRLGRDSQPALDPAVEQRLRDYYSADVEELAKMLNRDLGSWQGSRG